MKSLAFGLVLMPTLACAQEGWLAVRNDAGVRAALADRTIVYDRHTMQRFGADGDTQYVTERLSKGRWASRAGQYCSVWPPSDTWECYDLEINGDRVRFIGADNTVSEGRYR